MPMKGRVSNSSVNEERKGGKTRVELTFATVLMGLTSVVPADRTPINENRKPRIRDKTASPTFMLKSLAKIDTQRTMERPRPVIHHEFGTRSSFGVGSSSSSSIPSLLLLSNQPLGFNLKLDALRPRWTGMSALYFRRKVEDHYA